MPFRVVSGVDRGMDVLDEGSAKVHQPIELSFGVVSGVGQGRGVLDGRPHYLRGRDGFGCFSLPFV